MTTGSRRSAAAHGLDDTFAQARAEGRAALAVYLPVGYPTLDQSLDVLHVLAQHAEILELGLPFSDPLMDGPTIAAAATQALHAGFRVRHLLAVLRELRASSPASLLVMTYWQPVDHYGPQAFAAALADCGAAGVIIPDLPLEEAGPWLAAAGSHGLHTVFVVAPNTSTTRLAAVCAAGSGMIYAPATSGVTGHLGPLDHGLPRFVDRLRSITTLPIGVGIGVSTAKQAAQVSRYADAVIVGSALIRRIQAAPDQEGAAAAAELAAELAEGVRIHKHAADAYFTQDQVDAFPLDLSNSCPDAPNWPAHGRAPRGLPMPPPPASPWGRPEPATAEVSR
jgi:tryptophan synthase alpha chain